MTNRKKGSFRLWPLAGGLFLLFLLLLAAVLYVDVQPIGPLDSAVGLASLNGAVRDLLGVSPDWYDLTELLGLVSIAVACGFALLGLYQLLKRKSLRKVDADLLLLAGLYGASILCYLLFEVWVVNFRPVLLEGSPEASFPSSHTMLAVCILSSAIHQLSRRVRLRPVRLGAILLCALLLAVTVVGRLLSGVHWFTDILGGLLLSGGLSLTYIGLCVSRT